MTTLYEHVTKFYRNDCLKHGLADDCDQYVDDKIDQLSPSELLKKISDSLDEMFPYWLRKNDQ